MIEFQNLTQHNGKNMLYIRSTDVEQMNYHRLLWSVPDSILYYLSKNEEVVIVDKSTKKKGKVEKIFVPVLNDILNCFYFEMSPINKNMIHHFLAGIREFKKDKQLYRKFRFWKYRIFRPINIQCKTIRVIKER